MKHTQGAYYLSLLDEIKKRPDPVAIDSGIKLHKVNDYEIVHPYAP
jgi:hypothetical protein